MNPWDSGVNFLLNWQNYQLRLQQEVHFKTLVQSAKEYDDEMDKAEVVERDRVEMALTELLELKRRCVQEVKGM